MSPGRLVGAFYLSFVIYQKNIHPYPSSPYMERLKLRTAETDSSSCVLVSRDDAMGDERDLLGPPV